MTRERSDRDLAALLEAWMDEVAPTAIPVPVLEEAFARTMSASQVRLYPWERAVRRTSPSRRIAGFALAATAALLVAVLAFGALGGGLGMTPSPSPTPSATPVPPSSPSPPAIVPGPITPTASIPADQPMALASDGTSVWILTATGLVQRIDPATNKLGAAISTGATTDAYQGISADRSGVWVTESNTATLFRVDPVAHKVVTTIPVGNTPKGVLTTGSAVWVADVRSGTVLRIDPATNKVVATVTVGPTGDSGPNWLASGLGSIWVGIPNNQTVVRIDPTTNAIQATIPIPVEASPCGSFAITPAAVWITSCGGPPKVTHIDPTTNAVVGLATLDGTAYTPAVIDGAPWVSVDTSPSLPGALNRIAAATNAVDLKLVPGPTFGGGGDMVVAAGSVWVNDGGNNRILRLPLAGFTPG